MPYDPPKDWSETEIVLQEYNPPKDWSETRIVLNAQDAGQTSSAVTGSGVSDAENPSSTVVNNAVTEAGTATGNVSTSISEVSVKAVTEKESAFGSVAEIISKEVSQAVTNPVSGDGFVAKVINKDVSQAVSAVSSVEGGVATATQESADKPVKSGFGRRTISRTKTVDKTKIIGVQISKVFVKTDEFGFTIPKIFEESFSKKVSAGIGIPDRATQKSLKAEKIFDKRVEVHEINSSKVVFKNTEFKTECKLDNSKLVKTLKVI